MAADGQPQQASDEAGMSKFQTFNQSACPGNLPAGDTLRLGRLPTTPYAFYQLRFRSRAGSKGYWAVFPFDYNDQEMRADTHSSVYASDDWLAHETYFRGLPGATSVEVGFRACESDLEIQDVVVTPVSTDAVRTWSHALSATLPPVTFTPPTDRHLRIPQTMARLQAGQAVRVVMLGDSISQDTCNSYYDIQVEPMYPGADLQLVPSIDGSKGCWYYIEDERFQRYVVDQKPELLMIGTHSEHHGIGPVEQMLRRVQAELDCEVMVVSGPMGDDHRYAAEDHSEDARAMREEHLPRRRAFARQQAELCRDLGVAYFDLCSAWIDYLDQASVPYDYFHRDAGHANDRGKQVLAQLMTRYFATSQ